jgi:hypothetical protein
VRLRDHLRGTKEVQWRGKAIAVIEEGRRVHAFKLLHDVHVGVCRSFESYYAYAMADRQGDALADSAGDGDA